jgi:hypothetical protein
MAEREGLLAAYRPLVPSLSLGTAVAIAPASSLLDRHNSIAI